MLYVVVVYSGWFILSGVRVMLRVVINSVLGERNCGLVVMVSIIMMM